MDVHEILDLMEEKLDYFRQYEEDTEIMAVCGPDEMIDRVEDRQWLAEQIDILDKEILKAAGARAEEVENAARNRMDRGTVPEELAGIYDKGEEIFAVMNRIRNLEPLAELHAKAMLGRLEQKIREVNTGTAAKAAKFFAAAQIGSTPVRLSKGGKA